MAPHHEQMGAERREHWGAPRGGCGTRLAPVHGQDTPALCRGGFFTLLTGCVSAQPFFFQFARRSSGARTRSAGTRGDKDRRPNSLRDVPLPVVARAGLRARFGAALSSRAHINFQISQHACKHFADLPKNHRRLSATAGFDDQQHDGRTFSRVQEPFASGARIV